MNEVSSENERFSQKFSEVLLKIGKNEKFS